MALVVGPTNPPLPFLSTTATSTTPTTSALSSLPIHHHHSHLLNLIKNCSNMSQLKQIHAQSIKTTSPHHPNTLFLFSRIMHFAAFSDLNYASLLLHHIHNPNSFIWNTLIRAYAWSHDLKHHSIELYHRMLLESRISPDKHTYPFVLKACAYLFSLFEGQQIHGHILKLGFGSDVYVNNSLIHFYVSCGCLNSALKVFEKMSDRNLVSWNVMIDGFVQFGEFVTALEMFCEIQDLLVKPDGFTIQSLISACGGLGALSLGLWVHAYILRNFDSEMKNEVLMNNSLLDMYSKCGSVGLAHQVFDKMLKRDVTSWNSMILGFAMHGKIKESLDAFDFMSKNENLIPNSITFIGVLSACNHGGLVSEGQKYFASMVDTYNIEPQLEHYGCMVDLLARAGLIEEALNLVSNMRIKPDVVIWRSLLDACYKRNAGIEISERIAERILESENGVSSGVYVLLSKVYASANSWEEVGLVRRLMSEKGIVKEPGCSSIEIRGEVHKFLAGDTSHSLTKEIYQVLDVIEERLENVGYVPDLSQTSMIDELDERKEESLRLHSERLAIAFGLLNATPGMPIRVFKNLRVCNDCHRVTKLISKLFDVEIVVRDRVRFHHFKDGLCSCNDYW